MAQIISVCFFIMYDLNGKNAIVTGGASGIGYCIVRDLLRAGVAKCVFFDTNSEVGCDAVEQLSSECGKDRVYFIKCDVSNIKKLASAMETALVKLKTLDIFINNAGIVDENDWEKAISVNVNGVVNGTTLGMKYMGKNHGGEGGTIVNIASIAVYEPFTGFVKYTGTKHFVVGFTKAWSTSYYYEKTGVRMMVLCPGTTYTNMVGDVKMDDDDQQELLKQLSTVIIQRPDNVSRGMIHILVHGENDSIWISEEEKDAYEIVIPKKKAMRKI